MSSQTVTLDVREDIRKGGEPFSKIMDAVARLRPDENLLLLAPFEPKPLFGVLAKQGFAHTAREIEGGDWQVIFTRHNCDAPSQQSESGAFAVPIQQRRGGVATKIIEVDARGLEPPQPLVSILEALVDLPADAQLRAHTDRRPMHLYAQLEERGFTGESEEQNDGSFITKIHRR
jgi:uncharacterized protein (DUF2249 family)